MMSVLGSKPSLSKFASKRIGGGRTTNNRVTLVDATNDRQLSHFYLYQWRTASNPGRQGRGQSIAVR